MEWMSPMDSSFLHIENDTTPMHIGGVSIFEGPPPPFEDLRAMVAGKLGARPALPPEGALRAARRRPAGVGRRSALQPRLPPAPHRDARRPASDAQLRQMAARVFSQHLDRNKPLWELWMVEGLSGGRWALLSKVHHCMVDGVAATDLMSVMFSDETAAGDAPRAATPGRPRPSRRASRCSLRTLVRRASPAGQLETLKQALRAPRETLRTVAEVARARRSPPGRSLRPVGASSLTGPIGPHRRWSWATRAPVRRQDRARGARRHRQRRRADA